MKAINIEWVTVGDLILMESLPKEMEIPEGMEDEIEISDWITNKTGFEPSYFDLIEGRIRYFVCGIGYDEDDSITGYEVEFGDFDTYKEAYDCLTKLQNKKSASFFKKVPNLYSLLIQLEECDETEEEINCLNVINELFVLNPKFN